MHFTWHRIKTKALERARDGEVRKGGMEEGGSTRVGSPLMRDPGRASEQERVREKERHGAHKGLLMEQNLHQSLTYNTHIQLNYAQFKKTQIHKRNPRPQTQKRQFVTSSFSL